MFILAAKEGHCASWPQKQGGWLCFIITFSVFSFVFLLLCYFLSGVPKWSKSEAWSHKWSDFEIAVAVSRARVLLNFGSEGLWQYFSQVCVCACVLHVPKHITFGFWSLSLFKTAPGKHAFPWIASTTHTCALSGSDIHRGCSPGLFDFNFKGAVLFFVCHLLTVGKTWCLVCLLCVQDGLGSRKSNWRLASSHPLRKIYVLRPSGRPCSSFYSVFHLQIGGGFSFFLLFKWFF